MPINFVRPLGPLARRRTDRLPGNAPLPLALRGLGDRVMEAPPSDPLGRDPLLASLEAILLAADEPLPTRRLGQVAGRCRGRSPPDPQAAMPL
jgi:hypothetical protein